MPTTSTTSRSAARISVQRTLVSQLVKERPFSEVKPVAPKQQVRRRYRLGRSDRRLVSQRLTSVLHLRFVLFIDFAGDKRRVIIKI